ncbi:DNA-binding transcriptional regulator, MarR family [Streptosporangium subroseum]|uniref:DNA-binding transcriptional regulator, MarR family n=1 Tax=Streptosporangium subroseum TaxID=106412 RepID=A0A239NFS3_9ACTN|nr:MarR family transcriptional regulator [Streptosporangium subroseum]SNT53138.1 DNA-binding transcriptional regulator, MarR family [Streptosporangium subroseum]
MRPAEELRYLILAAQREGNRLLGQALRPLGITSSQAEVIRILQDRGSLTLNGLGDLLVCESGNSPSRLVDRLASAGLVNRQVPAHDRRHIELSLTEEGLRLARQIIEIEEDLYRSIDAASEGHDLDEITGFLRAFVTGLPAGQALARRIVTEQGVSP